MLLYQPRLVERRVGRCTSAEPASDLQALPADELRSVRLAILPTRFEVTSFVAMSCSFAVHYMVAVFLSASVLDTFAERGIPAYPELGTGFPIKKFTVDGSRAHALRCDWLAVKIESQRVAPPERPFCFLGITSACGLATYFE